MRKIHIIFFILFTLILCGCENKYTVTFNTCGGTVVENQVINSGSKAIAPINPTKNGYVFAGWELDGEEYTFDEKIENNIVLNAVWESDGTVVSYIVTYDIDGDTTSKEIPVGGIAPEPSILPIKDGYTFTGWYLEDSSTEYDFDTILCGDVTIYAKFSEETNESELQENSGTIIYVTDMDLSVDNQIIKVGESIQLEINFTPNNATSKEVEYSTSKKSIATVSVNGIIKGISAGEATITVATTDGGSIEKKITITVIDEE